MGIKQINVKEKLILILVFLQPLAGCTDGTRRKAIFLGFPPGSVAQVGLEEERGTQFAFSTRQRYLFGGRLPRVSFLPSNPLPGIEAALIIEAHLDEMRIVDDHLRHQARCAQNLLKRDSLLGQRLPFAINEAETTTDDIQTIRNGGK